MAGHFQLAHYHTTPQVKSSLHITTSSRETHLLPSSTPNDSTKMRLYGPQRRPQIVHFSMLRNVLSLQAQYRFLSVATFSVECSPKSNHCDSPTLKSTIAVSTNLLRKLS